MEYRYRSSVKEIKYEKWRYNQGPICVSLQAFKTLLQVRSGSGICREQRRCHGACIDYVLLYHVFYHVILSVNCATRAAIAEIYYNLTLPLTAFCYNIVWRGGGNSAIRPKTGPTGLRKWKIDMPYFFLHLIDTNVTIWKKKNRSEDPLV